MKKKAQELIGSNQLEIIRHTYPLPQAGEDNEAENDLVDYARAKRKKILGPEISFNDYIKEKYYKSRPGAIIVADLSDQHIESVDLSGSDLSGCLMQGVLFQNCNLAAVSFCDTDLQRVWFMGSMLTGSDFRGADLSQVKFDKSYQNAIDPTGNQAINIRGLLFSIPESLEREYLRANQEIEEEHKRDKLKRIEELQAEINQVAPWGYNLGLRTKEEVRKLEQEIRAEEVKKPAYLIDPSFLNVMGFERNFDPAYVRGSSYQERSKPRQYIKLTSSEVEDYLNLLDARPGLSINDFAIERAQQQNLDFFKTNPGKTFKLDNEASIIADCSRLDLRGLNLAEANLTEACFTGANLERCNFTGAILSRATFEGSRLKGAIFENTKAKDTNFFDSDLGESQINNSDFSRAFMPHSQGENVNIDNCDFHLANMRNGEWEGAKIVDSNFNRSNLEGITLRRAQIRGMIAQKARFKEAQMQEARVENSDFTKTNFEGAGMQQVVAPNIICTKANLNNVQGAGANFERGDFNGASAREANFNHANFAGAGLKKADVRDTNFEGGNLEEVKIDEAKVNAATNLAGAQIDKAEGNLKNFSAQGEEIGNITISKQKEKGDNAKAAQENGVNIIKEAGLAIKEEAQDLKDDVEGLKKIGKNRHIIGMAIGAVICAGVAIGVGALVIATGGFAGLAAIGILAAAAVVSAGVGTGIGYGVAEKIGSSKKAKKIGAKVDLAGKGVDLLAMGGDYLAGGLTPQELEAYKEKQDCLRAAAENNQDNKQDNRKDDELRSKILMAKDREKDNQQEEKSQKAQQTKKLGKTPYLAVTEVKNLRINKEASKTQSFKEMAMKDNSLKQGRSMS